jgi:hypothetical protein
MMEPFVYYARFEPGDERGVVVTFPDVPEAITKGGDETADRAVDRTEARGQAPGGIAGAPRGSSRNFSIMRWPRRASASRSSA